MEIRCERRVLGNGLSVLVHEDHTCPIVAVNVWYHVGSKNEHPGRTGLAHLFEHLMFEGSAHHDSGYFQPLQAAGALLNGSTNADRTNYWEVVPTGAVELALWLESDRMGYLLPALTDAKFSNQRDVVLNERRQNYENRPYGLAGMATLAALYPTDHPYNWLTIGSADDLRATTLDEVRGFFATHYHPGNASLAIAGAIETERAFTLAERYFGELGRGPEVAVPRPVPVPLHDDRRLLLEDRVELPRLYMAWHSPAMFAPGDAELDLVADLLTSGKTSRLYRRLVYEMRVATEVAAFQQSREASSYFQIVATATPDHSLDELERAIIEEVIGFTEEGPTPAELERVLVQAEAQFVYRLQTVGGFGGKSDQLNAYNVFLGDPSFFEHDLDRYLTATPAALAAATSRYLARAPRVAVSVVPRGQTALALTDSTPARVH
jgi:zinc protease